MLTNLYHPFAVPQRIRDQWEKKDNVCVKDETRFMLRHIGQDAEVTCQMLSLKKNPGPLTSVGTVFLRGILVHNSFIIFCNDFNNESLKLSIVNICRSSIFDYYISFCRMCAVLMQGRCSVGMGSWDTNKKALSGKRGHLQRET